MKFSHGILKSIIILIMLMLLSCSSNANNQNTTIRQELDISTEQDTTIPYIDGMTLIPSVEPEMLRKVMPNSWQKLSRLTETEEQAFIRESTAVLSQIMDT